MKTLASSMAVVALWLVSLPSEADEPAKSKTSSELQTEGDVTFVPAPREPSLDLTETGITLVDGVSHFTFAKGGIFDSGPLHMSGRTLSGKWEIADDYGGGGIVKVVVVAEQGWINGITTLQKDIRRLVFLIYGGKVVPNPDPRQVVVGYRPPLIFDGYWIIDEMTRVPN